MHNKYNNIYKYNALEERVLADIKIFATFFSTHSNQYIYRFNTLILAYSYLITICAIFSSTYY
jgi:hypothetical protein